ncbi:MAG: L-histidine N(alpha)-methyltransferase [archaeon]
MAFVRTKEVNGRVYYQLVENKLNKGAIAQKVIKHLGTESRALKYCKNHSIHFPQNNRQAATDSFFYSPKQSAEFVTALKGRKEIPLKFEYFREGSEKWQRVVNSPDYGLGSIELGIIDQNVKRIIGDVGKANIIDIGCGTGVKAMPLIREMSKIKAPKYMAFDISNEMLDLAKNNLKRAFPQLNSEFVNLDFEQTNLAQETLRIREKNFRKSLFIFLGNTLGNVSDKGRVLTNIRESMIMEDNLLIGNELFDLERVSDIISHYKKSREVRDFVLNSLVHYGLNEKDGKIIISFNKDKSQVEGHFALKKDKTIKASNKKIELKKGDKILLLVSYKGTLKKMQLLLADLGFVILHTYLTPREDYALILCKPTKI